MNNDGLNFTVSTGTGLAAWVTTFSMIVPVLWGVYVLILIVIKLPDFLRSAARLVGGLQRAWGNFKEWKRGSKN